MLIRAGAVIVAGLGLLGGMPRSLFAFAPPVVGNAASFLLITGTVAYRERIALPPNAVLRVSLEDVSRMDVAAKVIAEVNTLTDGKQVPLSFAIPYRRADVVAGHRYQVRAKIIVNGQARYNSTTAYPVLTSGTPTNGFDPRSGCHPAHCHPAHCHAARGTVAAPGGNLLEADVSGRADVAGPESARRAEDDPATRRA